MLADPALPFPSVAWTFIICGPLLRELVFMLVVQFVVPVAVTGVPESTPTCTCVIPALDAALPETVSDPETVALSAG